MYDYRPSISNLPSVYHSGAGRQECWRRHVLHEFYYARVDEAYTMAFFKQSRVSQLILHCVCDGFFASHIRSRDFKNFA